MNEPMKKGREGYAQMEAACQKLVESGNWQRVGASDIRLFLNMYVQALLLKMALSCGGAGEKLRRFIAEIPSRDVLSIAKADENAALNIGHKNRSFAEGTPLLLRCCVAMDDKDGTDAAQQFVDGVSTLLYAAAQCDSDLSGQELQFISTYLGGLRTFLLSRAAGRHVSSVQEQIRHTDVPGDAPSKETAKNEPKKEEKKT